MSGECGVDRGQERPQVHLSRDVTGDLQNQPPMLKQIDPSHVGRTLPRTDFICSALY